MEKILFSLLLKKPPLAEFNWKTEEKDVQFWASASGQRRTEKGRERWSGLSNGQ